MTFPTLNLPAIAPQVVLVVAALIILIADLLIAEKRILGWGEVGGKCCVVVAVFFYRSASPAFQTMALADGCSGLFASVAALIATAWPSCSLWTASPILPAG